MELSNCKIDQKMLFYIAKINERANYNKPMTRE
jgi:hypothetical protein